MTAPTFPHIVHKPMPASIPSDWALVPTEEEMLASDRARAALKEDQRYFALPDAFALEVELRGGA